MDKDKKNIIHLFLVLVLLFLSLVTAPLGAVVGEEGSLFGNVTA